MLVVGSLPPAGRDWDLLVHNGDRAAIEARLSASGFVRVQRRWVRPSNDAPDVVELVGAAEWRLPEHEVERLIRDAVPLDGHARLVTDEEWNRIGHDDRGYYYRVAAADR